MKKNVGKTDRLVRIIVGIIFLALGFFLTIPAWLVWVLMILGAYLVITGILKYDPLYVLLKYDTSNK